MLTSSIFHFHTIDSRIAVVFVTFHTVLSESWIAGSWTIMTCLRSTDKAVMTDLTSSSRFAPIPS